MIRFRLDRWHAFWGLQISGWSAYAASKLLVFPVTALDGAWVAVKGIALTLVLRAVLQRAERAKAGPAVVVGLAGGMSFALAWFALSLSHAVSVQGWLLTAPGTAQWLLGAEAFLLESLLFLAWSALYLGIRYGLDLHAERRRLAGALAEAQRARVQMLRYQLNPHFLFNALASLRALVVADGVRARRVIDDLSGFLRHALLDGTSDSISIEREMEAVRHYLAIQKLRFEERIAFEVSLDPTVAAARLPAFLVQPLVENAVKYGMRTTRERPARVAVRARREHGRCVLEVHNSGSWVAADEPRLQLDRSGIGLANVRARLAEQLRDGYRFSVGPVHDGVLARLELDVA